MKQLTLSGISLIMAASLCAQNVGIGTSSPAYKLDVAGRMRLRHNAGQTAGIYLDGVTLPTKSFIGTLNDTTVGIYGATAGWSFLMNTESGYVGINTALPTAELDVNGTLRMRGNFPKKGSVLTSDDNLGNAVWSDPVAFRVGGLSGGANQSISQDTWTKVMFNTSASFNLGLNYQPFLSQFLAGDNGIYRFTTQLSFVEHVSQYRGIRFVLSRNGNTSTLVQQNQFEGRTTNAVVLMPLDGLLTFDIQLQSGDVVWVETYVGSPIMVSSSGSYVTSTAIASGSTGTWFSGNLIARL